MLVAMEAARATSVGRSRGETLGIVTMVKVGARATLAPCPPVLFASPSCKTNSPEDQVCLANSLSNPRWVHTGWLILYFALLQLL